MRKTDTSNSPDSGRTRAPGARGDAPELRNAFAYEVMTAGGNTPRGRAGETPNYPTITGCWEVCRPGPWSGSPGFMRIQSLGKEVDHGDGETSAQFREFLLVEPDRCVRAGAY